MDPTGTPAPGAAATEHPILWLGLAGFAPAQRAMLEAALPRAPGAPLWRTCAFGDADAWLVDGRNVRPTPDGNLKVAAGLPTERALNLNPDEVDRPLAFALPLASAEFEPRCTFDPTSAAAVQAVLAELEGWLQLLLAQFVLGAQLVGRAPELRRGVYHVSHQGKLLAVLDLDEGQCAIARAADPQQLRAAQWRKRPEGARHPPMGFLATTPAQLAWAYVYRSERDLLPARYLSHPIHYRHVPRVPVRWLRDSQLMLLRELSVEPGTFEELRQRTGLGAPHLRHDLTCLYYTGAITTTRAKATRLSPVWRERQPPASAAAPDSLLSTTPPWDERNDLTAPAMLEPRSLHARPSAP